MNRKYITLIVLIILAIVGWFLFSFLNNGVQNNDLEPISRSETTIDTQGSTDTQSAILTIGNPNAKVTIIEYADYKCPECGKYHQSAGQQIRKDYVDTGRAKIVFRPYPVYAEDGAKALAGSYCAQNQGKFVEYHDALFEYMWVNHFRQKDYQKAIDPVLTEPVMRDILKTLGMNFDTYTACLNSEATKKAYEDDIYLAAPDEIQGTPSFIIGGQKIVGPQPYNVFKTLLDIQLR